MKLLYGKNTYPFVIGFFFCTILTFHPANLYAQASGQYTFSGYLRDAVNGETLLNASISISPAGIVTQTNAYGFFSVALAPGKYKVSFSYTGYSLLQKDIDIDKDLSLNISLQSTAAQLQEVTVSAEKKLRRTNTVALGIQQMDMSRIKKMPSFMGEPDVLKALLTMPGVTSAGDGAAGFSVRGGNTDENLILLDEAPVFNSSHLLGFFSVFNPDAVKNVTLYKSAFPAEFGGRTSSVLDIRMKDGNNQRLSVNGGISDIFSRISVEGPLKKDKSSFIIAARRSYIDFLAKPFLKGDNKNNVMYFYDLTAKGNWKLNEKNTLYLSGYIGQDVFSFGGQANLKWGNTTGTFRWNHLFTSRLFLNTSLYFSRYNYSLLFHSTDDGIAQSYDWRSNIRTYGVKPTLTWFLNNHHQIKTGASIIFYDFYPGQGILTNGQVKNAVTLNDRFGTESALFAEDTWKITPKIQLQAGIRLTRYDYLGHTDLYYFRDTTPGVRKPLDHTVYKDARTPVATWTYPEPRVSLRYEIEKNEYIKAGYSRNTQYIHLLSNTASPTPIDLYYPSTNNISPSLTDQFSAGWVMIPRGTQWEISAEAFYKKMNDVLDFIDNADLNLNPKVEGELLQGKGKSYGIEFEVKKEIGKWQGFANYTWSRSWRKTPGIGNGDWYRSLYDRPNILNVSVVYACNSKWTFSANFNYSSGTPATFPDTRLDIQGLSIPYNSSGNRNEYRLPVYHRLDLSAIMKGHQGKKLKQEWVFGLYNAYARPNAYSIYFRVNKDNPAVREAVRLSILGTVLPSVAWNFSF
jgi:outer membrane receptor protein involved in Fe transport